MRHIRNFLHNISDVVLALIIVAVAEAIIFWRMQIILDYPKTIVENQTVTEEAVPAETPAEEAAPEEQPAEDKAAKEEKAATEEKAAEEAPAETAPAEEAQ